MSSKLWNRLDNQAAELWKRPRVPISGIVREDGELEMYEQPVMRLDHVTRGALVVNYMPLAEMLATKRAAKNRKVDPDDFQSHAYMSLISAIDAYDPGNASGASCSTFIGWRIRGGVIEAERDNDWVSHKVRAELGDNLPRMQRFPDEHDGKRTRCENLVAEREQDTSENKPDLAAEMDKWPEETREVIELFLDCGWSVDLFVERVYGPESTVPEPILWKCGPPEKAVKFLKAVLASIGADAATISTHNVKEMPPVEHAERRLEMAV